MSINRSPRCLQQPVSHRPGQALDLRLSAPPEPVHPLQGEPHGGTLQRIGLSERLVQGGDAGDVTAHRRRGLDAGHGVDEGDDGGGGGRHRLQAVLPAPEREFLHIRPQRAFRVVTECTPGRFEAGGQLGPHLRGVFNACNTLTIAGLF